MTTDRDIIIELLDALRHAHNLLRQQGWATDDDMAVIKTAIVRGKGLAITLWEEKNGRH